MKRYSSLSEIAEDPDFGKYLSGLPFVDFVYAGGELFHEVQSNEQHRLDLIAYAYLKDFRLWPIIAWYNNIRDPLTEVVPGKVLVIPVDTITLLNNVFAFTFVESR